MACIISIETSTNVCSVAVSVDGKNIFIEEEKNGPSHATLLGVFADKAVRFTREKELVLNAIAVSCGPGSYTGLRIGVSEAKGLCYGMDIPLIAVNTPLIMAWKVAREKLVDEDVLLCPMIDARRMEVYSAIYNYNLDVVRDIQADIVDADTYRSYLENGKVAFFGNGSDKCKDMINSPGAIFLDDIYPSASDMTILSENAFNNSRFVDVAYFEPFYLKEFVATTPKNKVF